MAMLPGNPMCTGAYTSLSTYTRERVLQATTSHPRQAAPGLREQQPAWAGCPDPKVLARKAIWRASAGSIADSRLGSIASPLVNANKDTTLTTGAEFRPTSTGLYKGRQPDVALQVYG